MVASSDHPSIPAHRLAERLRDLREQERLTQKQLAGALGGSEPISIATVSLWEKPGSDRLPPPPRLAAYARLFCTSRSFASKAPRLLRDDELTEQERQREAELHAQLLDLRVRAQSTANATPEPSSEDRSPFWRFPAKEVRVSIVCSDADNPPPYADPSHLNYSRYSRHADLDALIEVLGQLRIDNPTSLIRILPTEELGHFFALDHLVLIGGKAVAAGSFAQGIPFPVAEKLPDTDTHVFKCEAEGEVREFRSERVDGVMKEDVGLIARIPHEILPERTVTMLSGITSRGVHGAALCFTNPDVKARNEKYLQEAFGNAEAFCILMRVTVQRSEALPPNLWQEGVRLYEWSAHTGAHW
jgi:transcriptional regulator with XRE-family HTH domain